jgi:hypothetical protein
MAKTHSHQLFNGLGTIDAAFARQDLACPERATLIEPRLMKNDFQPREGHRSTFASDALKGGGG